jgi:hypothetical protein
MGPVRPARGVTGHGAGQACYRSDWTVGRMQLCGHPPSQSLTSAYRRLMTLQMQLRRLQTL